jgi:two-component system NtrC family sensor kinase
MNKANNGAALSLVDFPPFDERHYKELWRNQVFRLLLCYLGPLILVIIYFSVQYNQLADESRRLHLQEIAVSQAGTLNLFLIERVANLENRIADPELLEQPTPEALQTHLDRLTGMSDAFVDLGFLDETGVQTAYAGPYSDLLNRNYSQEPWFRELVAGESSFVATDIYMGFRERPHFTLGVKRQVGEGLIVLRASLHPDRIYDYLRSLKGAQEVAISIVNRDGDYQLVTPHIGTTLESSALVPPMDPGSGVEGIEGREDSILYAYSWLQMADWALIIRPLDPGALGFGIPREIAIFAVPIVIVVTVIIFLRAKKLIQIQKETDRTRAQLEHAAKLASVGELAAGIAHEINNPLAVINEHAGLLKDLMNPEFAESKDPGDPVPYLDSIQDAVFRCRDVTHKLLRFVRRSEVELQQHDPHDIIDSVVDGLLGRELALSNIDVVRDYGSSLPKLLTDRNQLQQVLLNILNNAIDAVHGNEGTITLKTRKDGKWLRIGISDTGTGMTQDQLGRIFIPFYTTKEVGKGTGLGLAVSYGIVKDLGGEIEVESTPGVGSTFTLVLPLDPKRKPLKAQAIRI